MFDLGPRKAFPLKNAPSKHAKVRSQQRSIPQAVIDALADFGECCYDRRGAQRYSFTKRSWRAFTAYLGTEAKYFEKYRSAYIVLSGDGVVVTAGWRQ
jgi:hypothetical protein